MMAQVHVDLAQINKQFATKNLKFTDMREDKSGFINKTVFLKETKGQEYVLRLCSEREEFKHEKTRAEVNSLKHARNLGLTVAPAVFDHDSLGQNELGFEYILMEKVKGTQLSKHIETMSPSEVTGIMESLVDSMLPLWRTKFDKIGNLNEDMKPSKMALFHAGPFNDPLDMFPVSMDTIINAAPPGSISAEHKKKTMNLGAKLCEDMKAKGITPRFICFSHWDLNFDNILIEDGRVSGIVDWEWSTASAIEAELFNCDFYRDERFRNEFLGLVSKKLDFDAHAAMEENFDILALGLGSLVFAWHRMWGLTAEDKLYVQWVGELRKLFKKYDMGEIA